MHADGNETDCAEEYGTWILQNIMLSPYYDITEAFDVCIMDTISFFFHCIKPGAYFMHH